MANLNKVMLIGRLTADPEIRYTSGGMNIASMRMAVTNFRKDAAGNRVEEPCYIDCTAFGRTAELCQQYLKKGKQVFFEGHLRFEQWDDKNTGQKRSKHSLTVDHMQFLDGKGEGGEGGGAGEYSQGGAPRQQSAARSGPPMEDRPPQDDDIPF
jgi:single-strand DNA-binding protein